MRLQSFTWAMCGVALRQPARLLRSLFAVQRRLGRLAGGKRSRLRNERGDALMEMALSLPVLIMVTVGLVEICMAFYTHAYISELAREGSRYAMLRGPSCLTAPNATSCSVNAAANAVPAVKTAKSRRLILF